MLDQQKQVALESIVFKGECPSCQSKRILYNEIGQDKIFNCRKCKYKIKFKDSDFDNQDFVKLYS